MRYGERTARGIAGGKNVCWALTFVERIRVRSSKRLVVRRDMVKDIALLDRHGHLGNLKEVMATRRVE